MVFFVFGTYRTKKVSPRSAEVLSNNVGCLVSHCPGRLRVVELGRLCHFCFIPLFPVSTREVVCCTSCSYFADLDAYQMTVSRCVSARRKATNGVAAQSSPSTTVSTPSTTVSTPRGGNGRPNRQETPEEAAARCARARREREAAAVNEESPVIATAVAVENSSSNEFADIFEAAKEPATATALPAAV